jgi:hypothetical protein
MTELLTPSNIQLVSQLLQASNSSTPSTPEWQNTERKLSLLLADMVCHADPTKEIRLKYYESGIYQYTNKIIQAPLGKHWNQTIMVCWALTSRGVAVADNNEADRAETIRMAIHVGFLDLAIKEFKYRPLRNHGKYIPYATNCVTAAASRIEFVSHIVNSDAPMACFQLLQEGEVLTTMDHSILQPLFNAGINYKNLNSAFKVLIFLARFNLESVATLPSVMSIISSYLIFINNMHDDEEVEEDDYDIIMLGFRAAKLLIRLTSRDGGCKKLIDENPAILKFYPQLMRKLMDSKSKTTKQYKLFGSYWNLAGTCFELSLLAMSNINKELLIHIIPLVMEMMAYHSNNDQNGHDLMEYGLLFLAEICQPNNSNNNRDNMCWNVLMNDKQQIERISAIIMAENSFNKEILSLLRDVNVHR